MNLRSVGPNCISVLKSLYSTASDSSCLVLILQYIICAISTHTHARIYTSIHTHISYVMLEFSITALIVIENVVIYIYDI